MTEKTCINEDGKEKQVPDDHREINPDTGQQKNYVTLTKAEREKGFIRPVRKSYIHDRCKVSTTMNIAIAETYARDPKFYTATFCGSCMLHFPVSEFTWIDTDEIVGS